MDQVTSSTFTAFDEGRPYLVTSYTAECGCHWKVDMWGNVRKVRICQCCLSPELMHRLQLGLFSSEA